MPSQPQHPRRVGRIARLYQAMRRALGLGWIRADGYRPEKHYMRGPGPKSHTKSRNRENAREHVCNPS